ncbi:hypothetical protein I2492_16845 [Budviciaceae bacterium CWB-B4]|uniref:Uncharacterized protein n=1 Tax=Limnobaculum xujianqingii TaxID=2738837 RepID=A0A9D7AKP6_9GAMM|nr:hypothetical protein [Limnobaculum xujianqingii]MBK5074682.1 hypothetical protein [Limnobaculum xujianqingii]MBK5177986.1 hypothetical protein [Limnobaculum xujianqingii]
MALSTDEQIALLANIASQNVITEQERRKAIACLLSGTANGFDSESSAITWLLNNKIIAAPQGESASETSPQASSSSRVTQPENRISPQQQQHLDLLTQLHNTSFIDDQQFVDARSLLLSRNDLKFNTSYHLFLWLVEQGVAQEQVDHSAAQRSIQREANQPVIVQQAPPRSVSQPKKKSGFIKSKLLPFIIFFVFISWVNKCSKMDKPISAPQRAESITPLPVADIPPTSATPSVRAEQPVTPAPEPIVVAANCDHPIIVQSVLNALRKHYKEKHPDEKMSQFSAGKIIQTNDSNASRQCNMRIVPSDGESISYHLEPGNNVKNDVSMTISSFHGYDDDE